ncbi:hypothetical protein FHX42_002272 [Saccharopolyspora lacisalsi]|uniref:Uncharacterized protein n=1 Tax=Halosaccharopolyspora lacisalsi TaxID=1000566 RepID=A0A839DZT4_9PSEU|nr:hypothetical protein [Halosaccharopolyspora lacisalsi]MBA8824925.1 hypothetical protein [Halosaccharopolyspora lacisalsi]
MTERAESDRVIGTATDLDLLAAHLEALHELATDPDRTRDEGRVYDFSIRWGTLLAGRLERLEHYYLRDELPPEDRNRYEQLRTKLRESVPQLERLNLPHPTVALGDTGSGTVARTVSPDRRPGRRSDVSGTGSEEL